MQGGSPAKFLSFFDKFVEKEQSLSLDRGSLLHLWHKDKSIFAISDTEKPSDMMAAWCERVYAMVKPSGMDVGIIPTDIVMACREGAYASIKDEKKHIEKFNTEGLNYLKFLFNSEGKICVTPKTKEILEGCINALESHKRAKPILFGKVQEGMERLIELEIYWEEKWSVEDKGVEVPTVIKMKAMLDNVVLDYNNKIAYINDLKYTSMPVSLFKNSFIKYHYYRQMAFYARAIFEYLKQKGLYKQGGWRIFPRLIVVDSTPFFNVHSCPIDATWQSIGAQEAMDLMDRVNWHQYYNEWKYTPEESVNNYDNYFLDFKQADWIKFEDYAGRIIPIPGERPEDSSSQGATGGELVS